MEEHTKKRCCLEENNNDNNGDRLSSLPDTVIADILSLLPTKSAISTSILSRRWRNLWTQIYRLSLSLDYSSSAQLTFKDFSTRVDHILKQITSPQIRIFELKLSTRHIEDRCFLESWVRQICTLNPQEIKVEISNWGNPSILISIPSCVFECPSLVSLHFGGGYSHFDYKFPDNVAFNIPNLKKLHISILESHCSHMELLLKSCPLLEDLFLGADFEEAEHSLDIRGHNLRHLELHLGGESKGTVFLINAPKLEEIEIQSMPVSFYRFVNSPSGLLKANISVGCDRSDAYDCLNEALELIHAVSCVRSLRLHGTMFHRLYELLEEDEEEDEEDAEEDDEEDEEEVNGVLPIFDNLTELDILYWDNWLPFLRCCPNLEAVLLFMDYKFRVFFEEEDMDPMGVPDCFSTTLKKIDIEGFQGTDYEWNFLGYVLSNASVLEELNISLCLGCDCGLAEELEFCRALFSYPRSSLSCVIELRGGFLSASSKSFKNEVLDCQVRFKRGFF